MADLVSTMVFDAIFNYTVLQWTDSKMMLFKALVNQIMLLLGEKLLSTTNVLATGFETLQIDLTRTEPQPRAKKPEVLARPCNVWVSARNRCTAASQKPSKNENH